MIRYIRYTLLYITSDILYIKLHYIEELYYVLYITLDVLYITLDALYTLKKIYSKINKYCG